MAINSQSDRLSQQHEESHGVIGIFGDEARKHDKSVYEVTIDVLGSVYTRFEL